MILVGHSLGGAHQAAFGWTPTARLADAGMLDFPVHRDARRVATDDDIAAFVDTGVMVNHNPTGNAMLGFRTTAARSVPQRRPHTVIVDGLKI